MIKILKYSLFLILLINCAMLSGCWSYNEVNDRLIATSVGIDYSESNEKYRVTIKAINATSGGTGVDIIPEVVSVEGDGVFDAIRKSSSIFGKKSFWSHMTTLIVSENIASKDILKALDFFNRDPEVRQDCIVYIASSNTAEEMIRLEAALQKQRNYTLSDAIETQRFIGSFPLIDLHEFTTRSIDSTVEPFVPIIDFYRDSDVHINLEGSAVFLHDKMAGKLNSIETLFTLLIRNDITNPLILIPVNAKDSSNTNSKITLEIYNSESKIRANTDNEDIRIIINIKMNMGISELNDDFDFSKEDYLNVIESACEKEIQSQIATTIKRVQDKYKSDIFGFGKAVQISNPKLWKKLKGNWCDKFSELPVDVNLKLNIISTGKAIKSF